MVKNMTFPLTVRQRIYIYLVFAALAGLACAGVDFTIDANRMDADVPAATSLDCTIATNIYKCSTGAWSNGTCHLKACSRPPDSPATPVTNCPFGSSDQGRPWTASGCTAQVQRAGCTEGTLYSFGCYGYTCTDSRCGR
jgi:hypothetical protein